MSNCHLIANFANGDGGGVAGGTLRNSTLIGNSAGANGGGAISATLYNCTLRLNSVLLGSGGGAIDSTLYNCTLIGNKAAADGGGAFASTLYNCTVTLNSAQGAGGGVSGNRPHGVYSYVYNCIVYHNKASHGRNYDYSRFLYSCTTPLPAGEGNIDSDPQLASATHLSAGSPCIGAGSTANASEVDIDGDPWADPPSMGADEFTAGSAIGPITVSIEAAYTNVAVAFSNSFDGLFEGRFATSVWDFGDGTVRSNQPATTHAWSAPGTYTVTLRGFNESCPQGVSAQIQVMVSEQPIYYVNKANPTPAFPYASWQTAATNIQDAVDAATFPGGLVLVTNGIYEVGAVAVGNNQSNRVALTNPIVLRSVNGPEVTTVLGCREFSFVRCVYVGANAILSGFTLTNGYAAEGGGVWCESSGMVSNCVIRGNSVVGIPGFGGGAFGGTLSDCTLIDNLARSFRYAPGYGGGAANAALYNCVLAGNSVRGRGGGAAESTLHHCVLTGNSADGYGVEPGEGGGAYGGTLYNCVLTANSAKFWSWLGNGGAAARAILYNCVLTGNSAGAGGGAYGGTLNNCTLTANSAESGGGAYGDEWDIGPAILHNCIVYDNTAANGPNYFGAILDYSCTAPLPTNGVGNIDGDPLFVNREAGDLRLRADSPCIDAGTNLTAILTTNLAGLPRPLDGNGDGIARFDMGAYEFNPYRFATLQVGTNGFQFTVRGEPGKSVRIERSRDLVHWELAGQMSIPASGQTMTDPMARSEPQLFYRAVSVP